MHRLTVALLTAWAYGCGAPTDSEEAAAAALQNADHNVMPALLALIDSAAAAYGAGQHLEARRLYLEAVSIDSTLAAPWFGYYMVGHAMGDTAAADSALKKAMRLVTTPAAGSETGARAP